MNGSHCTDEEQDDTQESKQGARNYKVQRCRKGAETGGSPTTVTGSHAPDRLHVLNTLSRAGLKLGGCESPQNTYV
jgi:hypothetical protein